MLDIHDYYDTNYKYYVPYFTQYCQYIVRMTTDIVGCIRLSHPTLCCSHSYYIIMHVATGMLEYMLEQ